MSYSGSLHFLSFAPFLCLPSNLSTSVLRALPRVFSPALLPAGIFTGDVNVRASQRLRSRNKKRFLRSVFMNIFPDFFFFLSPGSENDYIV